MMDASNSYKQILKYIGLFGSVQGMSILVGLVRTKLVAIILGPSGVGLISIFNTASTFLQNATNFGIQTSGVREISQAHDADAASERSHYISVVRTWSLFAALLGAVVCAVASPLLSRQAFSSYGHTVDFLLLAPVVAMAAITGGELAILKAMRRMRVLARTNIIALLLSTLVSIALYVEYGVRGIIPSLVFTALVQMVLTTIYGIRTAPYRLLFSREVISDGRQMVTIGLSFVVAGVCGSGMEFLIRSYLSGMSVSLAGLYNAGYMISMTYAGVVFAAMESDYFPKLSAVCHDPRRMHSVVNRQIDASLTIVSPMLLVLMCAMPVVIPLLFSSKFNPVVPMTQITLLAMYFRAVVLPLEYITLAKGDSRAYMAIELAVDATMVVSMMIGFSNWGLAGTGVAIVVTYILETVCVMSFSSWRYDLIISTKLLRFVFMQIALGVVCLVACLWFRGVFGYVVMAVAVAVGSLLSFRRIRRKLRSRTKQ